MNEKTKTGKILCMFSGGLDSTGMLYRLLTDARHANQEVHVHHLVLKNLENRHPAEKQAVHRIIDWLRRHDFRRFVYTESEHEYTFMKRYFVYDSFWYGFMAANIVTADPSILQVAVGRTRSDYDLDDTSWLTIANRGREVYQAALPLELRFNRPYVYPVLELTKREIWAMLPPALRDFAWSCRTPAYDADRPRACGKCPACLSLRQIRASNEKR
ncbi:MAG: hypothetical protein DWQ08_02695 [Proteobacteria bacterium]|nr:MAG: hypothetical protein DWQ08_02695 [Pseudomonadota bacterium]